MHELDGLLAWMRANGVQHARYGDVELSLADAPAPDEIQQEADSKALVDDPEASLYPSPYDDPDLYPDGRVPRLTATAPKTPKKASEDVIP